MNKRIAKNYIYNTLYQVLAIVAPLITAPYVSRILHTDGVGLYSYTNTITSVFSLIAGLGFVAYGQREIAYNQEDEHQRSIIFFEIMLFRAILTIAVSVAFVVFSLFYSKYTIYLLPQTTIIIATIFEMSWYFQGLENFRIIVTRNAIIKLATILCTFLFVKTEADIGKYILIHALSPLISNVVYCVVIKKYITRVDVKELHPLRHVRGSIEFFLPLIAVQIYSYLDKLMLGMYMTTTVENGYYEQARKITSIIVTLIVSLNTVMMSRISNLYTKEEKDRIKQYYAKTFGMILMMLFPICAGLVLVAENFAIWYFGVEFSKVGLLLKLCSILIVFMSIGNFAGIQFLSPTGLQRKMTIAYIIAAICNAIMNMLLIPVFFSIGALVASIIAEGISCGIQMWLLYRSEYRFKLSKDIWKYVFGTLIMVAIITLDHRIFMLNGVIATSVDLLLGAITYIISLIAFKESNIMELLSILKRRKIT